MLGSDLIPGHRAVIFGIKVCSNDTCFYEKQAAGSGGCLNKSGTNMSQCGDTYLLLIV